MAKKKTQSSSNGHSAGKKESESGAEMVELPFVHKIPSDQLGILSNQFVIQGDGPEFHLLFFQTRPPMILGDTEAEIRKSIQKIKSVDSVCVARIIVSAERLPLIIRAMQDNLEKQARLRHNVENTATQEKKDT